MGKILYLECNSGISGDMTVGALLDLGADRKVLENALESMGIDGYHLHFGRKETCGLDAYDFDVHLEENKWGEDHSHCHQNGAAHMHGANHAHQDGAAHVHETNHPHTHEADGAHIHGHNASHSHTHVHRNLKDVYEIIDRLNAANSVKDLAKKMFRIVAEAESKAHGLPMDQVHFHEVGAVDSIIDIVSVAVCVDNLGIEDVAVSSLSEGHGHVHCQHGVLPVPVPATANIAAAWGLKFRFTDNDGEMVTPTGAAIAAALKTRENLPANCQIKKIGMGAGNRKFRQANVLRAMILETEEPDEREDQMWIMETNLDDSTGEMLGFAMENLLEAGASDVWYTPIYMKKNRPAYQLSVLFRESVGEKMEDILFCQTTTIGVRRYPVERTVLERQIRQVETPYGTADVKVCEHKGKVYCYPEYASVYRICKEQGMDFQNVYYEVQKAAEEWQMGE